MKRLALLWIFLSSVFVGATATSTMLTGCKSQPPAPVWNPPDPAPTPTPPKPPPPPPPAPTGLTAWADFDPVLVDYANGVPIAASRLDSVLKKRQGDRTDPITHDLVLEYWVVAATGVERLSVYAHFPNGDVSKASQLNVR